MRKDKKMVTLLRTSTGKNLQLEELLAFLSPLFRKGDLDTCLRNERYSAQVLNRALKRRFIARITRGVYLNVLKCSFTGQWPAVEETACYIKPAAYISLEWALHYWDLILQKPVVCTAVVSRVGRLREVHFSETYHGTKVEYHIEYSALSKIPRHFGIERLDEMEARMALPERALLDWIHVRRPSEYLLRSWVDEMDLENLSLERLKDFSAYYPARVKKLANLVMELCKS